MQITAIILGAGDPKRVEVQVPFDGSWGRAFEPMNGALVEIVRENVPMRGTETTPPLVFSARIAAVEQGIRFRVIQLVVGTQVCVPKLPGVSAIHARGNSVVVGDNEGSWHCIAPGKALRVRFALGDDPSVIYRRDIQKGIVIAPGVTAWLPDTLAGCDDIAKGFTDCNAKPTPIGERFGWLNPQMGGVTHLDFLPAYDQRAETALRRSDAVANAEAMDWLEIDTMGSTQVLAVRPRRSAAGLDGLWYFARPGFIPPELLAGYDRVVWGPGEPAPYEDYSAGIQAYRDCQDHNLEHKRRATAAFEGAARVFGDRLAELDLERHAMRLQIMFRDRIDTWESTISEKDGRGHPDLGGRWMGWLTDALSLVRSLSTEAFYTADVLVRIQMPNGARKNKAYPWYSNPDPHVASPEGVEGIKKPLDKGVHATQLLEETIMNWGVARAGRIDSAVAYADAMLRDHDIPTLVNPVDASGPWKMDKVRCLMSRFGYLPKFQGVTDERGVVARQIVQATDLTDYYALALAGHAAFLSRDPKPYIEKLLKMRSPMGRELGTKENAIAVLSSEIGKEATGIAVAALLQRT